MTGTYSKTKPLSFAISYGFMGGPLYSRRLRKMMKEAGYTENSTNSADIVIAHSGGVYLLDPSLKPKLLLLVAPALSRENPHELFSRNARQLRESAQQEHYRIKRFLWSLYSFYRALRNPRRNYQMIKNASNTRLDLADFKDVDVLFITNKNDEWPTGSQVSKLLTDRSWSFIALPGNHEHIWVHPEDYVDIINWYAKRLLAQAN